MATTRITESAGLTASGTAGALTGLGVLLFALAPLAIPILIVTAVFVAPLVLVGVAAALPIAVVAGVLLIIRATARRVGRHAVRADAEVASSGGERRAASGAASEGATG